MGSEERKCTECGRRLKATDPAITTCNRLACSYADKILALRNKGLTAAAIAQNLGIGRFAVDEILQRYGLTNPVGRPRGSRNQKPRKIPDHANEIRALRDKGLTLDAIGAELGISKQRVHQIIARSE